MSASSGAITVTPSPESSDVTRALAAGASPPVHTSLELDGPRGRYEVLEELGRGGMGEVHLCLDRRIGRQVARKRRAKDGAELKRFLREVSVQGQLEHPTIVPLHDLSAGEDGELYFTMKAIRGRTLKAILGAIVDDDPETIARFPTRKLLGAFSNVCLGVAFAHSRGVLHRDLKPDNLMLGEFGEVYILDWGVAKLVGLGETDDELMRVPLRGSATKVGSMIGTAGYMSPEQCTGDTSVDERSDVYSLGAILFELLAGEPLHGGTALEKIDSTLAPIDVVARASRFPREVAELATVCAAATRRAREDRLASARELHEAIERCLSYDRDVDLDAARADAAALAIDLADERAFAAALTAPAAELPPEVARELERLREADAARGRRRFRLALAAAATLLVLDVALVRGVTQNPTLVAVVLALLNATAFGAPLFALARRLGVAREAELRVGVLGRERARREAEQR